MASGANLPSLTSPVTITATVTDDGMPALTADAAVEITVIAGNVAPMFDKTDYAFGITEDAANSAVVGPGVCNGCGREDGAGTGTGWSDQTLTLSAPLSNDVGTRSAPAFGDVDGDGDDDLLVGENDGTLNFYRWGDGAGTGMGWSDQTSTLSAPLSNDVGSNSDPAFGDVNGDGDDDLLIGRTPSTLAFYRWDDTGWTVANLSTSPLGIGFGGSNAPAFGDIDGDGGRDLLVGRNQGDFFFFYWHESNNGGG